MTLDSMDYTDLLGETYTQTLYLDTGDVDENGVVLRPLVAGTTYYYRIQAMNSVAGR